MQAKMYNYSIWVDVTEPKKLNDVIEDCMNVAGFNVLNKTEHHFKPFGYTGLYLLSESHLAIHTFPEEETAYIELSSCIKKPFDMFINELTHKLK